MSSRLRLALVSDAVYPWHKGGKEVRYHELVKRLDQYNIATTIYTMRWWGRHSPDEFAPNPHVQHHAIAPKIAMYNNDARSTKEALLFALCTLRLLTARFDVLEADHMPYLQLVPLRLVTWLRRKPFIVTWHEVWGRDYWVTYMKSPTKGSIAAFIERFCSHLPDRIVAVSEHTAQGLRRIGVNEKKLVVLPNAVDVALEHTNEVLVEPTELLVVGRLLEHKRVDVALRALGILLAHGENVRLGVVGVGPEMQRLRSLADDLGVASSVVFYGELADHTEVYRRIACAKALFFPSEREGFGLVVAEALALGTPVLCAHHSANAATSLITNTVTGSLVAPGDAAAFAIAATFWLKFNDATSRSARVSAFHHEHSEMGWDVAAKNYAALVYKEAGQ